MTQAEIKRRLSRTWFPFFSRFGRLTPIQQQAIPLILQDENLVLISPAASGKTEAVVAPLVERMIEQNKRQFAILYISPTRALVNDLYRRLENPFRMLSLPLAIKTGDRPVLDFTALPMLLITTPESFDSLLSRHPKIFEMPGAVVLDELHLLDRTPRGDQVRVLLERLRRINRSLSYYAMSATIDDLDIGGRYFAGGRPVVLKQERPIDYRLLKKEDSFVRDLYRIIRERQLDKVLVFFNSRSHAEQYGREFNRPPFRDRVLVHHASLTRERRETIERAMNQERTALLCATTTLELGIDIGDIDGIVLFRPPYSVSSLLQRIGRGNRRRTDALFAIGVYLNDWERLIFELAFECARSGRLFEKGYRPSLAVIPQQIYSYLLQRRRIGATKRVLKEILRPLLQDETWFETQFSFLVDNDYIQSSRTKVYFLGEKLEAAVERGKVHSNIQEKSFGLYTVFNAATGQKIGQIYYVFEKIFLAGKSWRVVQVDQKAGRVMVEPSNEVGGAVKLFEGTGIGGHNFQFGVLIKRRIFPELAASAFPYFHDCACLRPKAPRGDTVVSERKEGNNICLFHFLNPVYGSLLAEVLSQGAREVIDVQGKILVFHGCPSLGRSFPVPNRAAVRRVISRNLMKLEDNLGSGAFFRHLPKSLQVEDLYQALNIDGLLEYLEQARLVEIDAAQGRTAAERVRE